jgi:hypothetical protein
MEFSVIAYESVFREVLKIRVTRMEMQENIDDFITSSIF